MKYSLFLISVGMTIVGHFFRVKRFSFILDKSITRDVQYQSLTAGYIINAFFPIRLGELVRAFVLSGPNIRNFLNAISSIIIERALDAFIIATSTFALFLWSFEKTQNLDKIFVPYLILLVLFSAILIVVVSRPNKLKLKIFTFTNLLPRTLRLNVFRLLFNTVHNIKLMLVPRNLYKILAYTVGMWIFYFVAYIFLVKSLGFQLVEGLSQILTHLFTFEINEKNDSKIYSTTLFTIYLIVPAISLLLLSRFVSYFQSKTRTQSNQVESSEKLNFANSQVELEFYGSYFKSKNKDFYLNYKDIFEDCEIVKDESGASGAVTSIIKKQGEFFYRKYSYGDKASVLAKQLDFLNNSTIEEFVKIVKFRKSDSIVYYDMKYQNNCLPMSQALFLLRDVDMFQIIENILVLLDTRSLSKQNSKTNLEDYVVNKVQKNLSLWFECISKLDLDIHLPLKLNGILYPSISKTYSDFLKSDFNLYFSKDQGLFLHGDLTLENIIWNPESDLMFYLIDPNTGSNFSSYESEIAKIYQSIEFDYENLYRYEITKSGFNEFNIKADENLKYRQMQKYLDMKLIESRSKVSLISIKMHTLIHLLRVLPYVKNTVISQDVLAIQIYLGLHRRTNYTY